MPYIKTMMFDSNQLFAENYCLIFARALLKISFGLIYYINNNNQHGNLGFSKLES